MSKKKSNKAMKSNKSRENAARKEHLTNMYMIQLCLGLLGIFILTLFRNLYKNPNTLIHMQTVTWIMFGVFALVCIALIAVGKAKKCSRCVNYGILSAVCAFFSLWLALFNKIRVILENILHSITGNEALSVNSYWNITIPIILIVAYLIIAFIVYAVKLNKKN